MATWQWFVLAIPALVLVVSIVMIIRLLLGATQSPVEDEVAAGAAEPQQVPAEDADPVELGESFDGLFVEDEAQPAPKQADDPYRRPVSPAEPESMVPRRVTESPS